jgi:hypothetical protein
MLDERSGGCGKNLSILAKDKKEWARRVRELRTEQGWPIVTKSSRQDLDVGVYVLEEDRQTYEHDRKSQTRCESLCYRETDSSVSNVDGWNRSMLSPEDPRKMLELLHVKHHIHKGENHCRKPHHALQCPPRRGAPSSSVVIFSSRR